MLICTLMQSLFFSTLSHTQDFDTLASYIQNQQGSPFLAVMSDFHLLLYLYTNDIAGIALKVQ